MVDKITLKKRYNEIALSKDDNTTASDFLLRELEIDLGAEYIRDGDKVLDVGCGLGYALRQYGTRRKIIGHGLDYAENMVEVAKERLKEDGKGLNISFHHGSVAEMPFDENSFDVVTSHRCLMALLDWDLQKQALDDLNRVLKPGGYLVLMEGSVDGLNRLNFYRRLFDLAEIDPEGSDRLFTKKFVEKELLDYVAPNYELVRIKRFGMYYFMTRIVQPLLVEPENPRYDHELNYVAHKIAKLIPDLDNIGHLIGVVLRKRV